MNVVSERAMGERIALTEQHIPIRADRATVCLADQRASRTGDSVVASRTNAGGLIRVGKLRGEWADLA